MKNTDSLIKGLQCCFGDNFMCNQNGCPYYDGSGEYECENRLRDDAVEVLKAQQTEIERLNGIVDCMLVDSEPRVMTADDFADRKRGDVLILEQHNPSAVINAILLEVVSRDGYDDERIIEVVQVVTAYTVFMGKSSLACDKYNKTWRCWTKKPTKEQMQAVNWDEEH